MSCEKRTYNSVEQARLAHRKVSWRLRVYWCDEHQGWHVTNDEKRGRSRDGDIFDTHYDEFEENYNKNGRKRGHEPRA